MKPLSYQRNEWYSIVNENPGKYLFCFSMNVVWVKRNINTRKNSFSQPGKKVQALFLSCDLCPAMRGNMLITC